MPFDIIVVNAVLMSKYNLFTLGNDLTHGKDTDRRR
jgi:hypothetical protein